MLTNKIIAVAGLLFLCLAFNFAWADSLDIEITTGAFLINPLGSDGVLLLKFDMPPNLADSQIVFAELDVPITPVIPDSSLLMLHCNQLAIQWDPSTITWADLGDTIGSGVIVGDGSIFASSTTETQQAYIDITELMKSWARGDVANNGVVLFRSIENPSYFGFDLNGDSSYANVKLTYLP